MDTYDVSTVGQLINALSNYGTEYRTYAKVREGFVIIVVCSIANSKIVAKITIPEYWKITLDREPL